LDQKVHYRVTCPVPREDQVVHKDKEDPVIHRDHKVYKMDYKVHWDKQEDHKVKIVFP